MIFIPIINILNISIILMTIIVFFNYSSAGKPKPTLFQLVMRSDTNYFDYSARTLRSDEKKLSIYEFYLSKHNLEARRIPLPSDYSVEGQTNRIKKYCTSIPEISNMSSVYIQDFDVYYPPENATNAHCNLAFGKLTSTLIRCLSSVYPSSTPDQVEEEEMEIDTLDQIEEEEMEIALKPGTKEENEEIVSMKKKFKDQIKKNTTEYQSILKTIENVPTALKEFLNKIFNNNDESNAAKSCSTSNLKTLSNIFVDEDSQYVEEVITNIGKIIHEQYEVVSAEKETEFYMCIKEFKNGVTKLNEAIGKYTPDRISKKVSKTLTPEQKKIYNRKIIELEKSNTLTPEQKKKILEIDEVNFLKAVVDFSYNMTIYNKWKGFFTGNYEESVMNDNFDTEKACIGKIKIMDQLTFNVTKLSYMIYPNKLENEIQKYINRKHLIINYLKLLDKPFQKNPKNNESEKKEEKNKTKEENTQKTNNNHIYESYEDENNKMNKKSFKRLKLCRAIPGEAYDTYVIRLNNNDCVPLHKNTWESEIIVMKSIGDINIKNLSEFSQMNVYL